MESAHDPSIKPLLGEVALPERSSTAISLEEISSIAAPKNLSDDVKSALDIFGGAEIMTNG